MDAGEFKQVLVDLGKRDVTDQMVQDMISQVDRNNDRVIQWNEFLDVSRNLNTMSWILTWLCVDV